MRPLWIDSDMGFDDMLAILMVAQSDRPIAGCSLVFGNSVIDRVGANAAAMANAFGWRFPVHIGAAGPIVGQTETAARVLGPDGLPTLGRTLPEENGSLGSASAFIGLAQALESAENPLEVLALGPLSNLAIMRLARPDLYARIGQVTWMGGSSGHGNHTRSAEFNAYADPEAAAIVVAGGVPLRVIDLDVCRQVTVTPDDLAALRAIETDQAAVLHDLFGGYIDIGVSRGRQSMALYDPVAAAAVISDRAIAFEPVHVEIERTGTLTRGRTIVDERHDAPHNAQLGVRADADLIRTLALGALEKAACA